MSLAPLVVSGNDARYACTDCRCKGVHGTARASLPSSSPGTDNWRTRTRLQMFGYMNVHIKCIFATRSVISRLCAAPKRVFPVLGKLRWGVALGSGLKMEDSLWAGLTDSHAGLPMGMTAENLAEKVRCCQSII